MKETIALIFALAVIVAAVLLANHVAVCCQP
jgi:hypothetical protein